MLKVKLIKISSTHTNLRTNEIEGQCTHIPEVHHSFQLLAPPLESGNVRIVTTSGVASVEYDSASRVFIFQTQNSHYQLQVLDDKDPFEYSRRPEREVP